LFLSIFIFVHQNFDAMNLGTKYKQLFNKIKSFPSNVYKKYRNRGTRKTTGQSFKTGAFNKTQFHSAKNKSKKGYVAGGVGILGSLYAALWPKVNAKAEGNRKASDKKEEIKKSALKTWKKEIKNPDAFDDKELPEDMKKILDKHYEELWPTLRTKGTDTFDFLPNYIIKRAIFTDNDRISGAKAMTAFIDQYHLTHLFVPKKYTYMAPDGRKYVIAKLVEQSEKPITKEELEQLIFLAKKLGWTDTKSENFLKTSRGLAIVDTEPYYINKEKVRHYVTVHDLTKQQWLKINNFFLPAPKKLISKHTSQYQGFNAMNKAFLTEGARQYLQEIVSHYSIKIKKFEKHEKIEEEYKIITDAVKNAMLQYIKDL